MLGWCISEGKLDESQKANLVIRFKEEVELVIVEVEPDGAWKNFACTCSFQKHV